MERPKLIEIVHEAPLGRRLDDAEVESFLEAATLEEAGAGTVLLSEGRPGRGLVVLADGEVEVVKRGDGGEHQLAVLDVGSAIGESGLTGGRVATATVRVLRPVQYLLWTREAFDKLMTEHPRVAAKVALAIAQVETHRLHRMNEKVLELVGNNGKNGERLQELARFREQLFTDWDF